MGKPMAGVRSVIWRPDMLLLTGGLPGRPVELVAHDDQTNPSTVPGIGAFLAKGASRVLFVQYKRLRGATGDGPVRQA